MATISNKSKYTLINNFVKRPKEYYNYAKHCLKILETYVWLKENQYNIKVDSYDYFSKFISYFGMDAITFSYIFKDYQNDIIDKIEANRKEIIPSNIYYLNQIDTFIQNIQKSLIEISSTNNPLIEGEQQNIKFNRLDFVVINLEATIDFQREYTYSEIYNMVLNREIIVLDNYTSEMPLFEKDLNFSKKANRIFLSTKNCEILGINSKIVDNYYSCNSEEEKKIWGIINAPFCNYFRTKKIDFYSKNQEKVYDVSADFNDTINHILDITNDLLKYYRKKKKELPPIIEKTSNQIKTKITELKDNFESINTDILTTNIIEESPETVKRETSLIKQKKLQQTT